MASAVQSVGLPIWSNLGFRVLLKDTSAHGLGGVGDRTANLVIITDDPLYPLSHIRPKFSRMDMLTTYTHTHSIVCVRLNDAEREI